MNKDCLKKYQVIFQELFYASFLLLLLSIFLEIIFPNIILVYFNLNYLLVLTIIFGLLALFENK